MATIIAATDFSDVGNNAVNYACSLAPILDASVLVFHAFVVPVTFSDTPMPILPVDDRQQIAEEQMAKLLGSLKEFYPQLNITGKIIYGDVIDDLEEFIEEDTMPRLIVMGNSGDISVFLGSTILSALRDLRSPVLAVPVKSTYRPIKKVCFAYDSKTMKDYGPVHDLFGLVKELGAELHVLSIDHSSNSGEERMATTGELNSILDSLQPEYHLIDSANTDESISKFIQAKQMDLLVVVPHKHSFFESLFNRSHTAELVHSVHIPLIALHEMKLKS